MKILGIIPARYQASRLPRKPLLDFAGVPMVVRVYKQAQKAKHLDHLLVATDHEEIYNACKQHGCSVVMTSPDHPSGTDRIAEAANQLPEYNVIINIQGDEPFIQPEQIDCLASVFLSSEPPSIATLIKKIQNEDELFNPSVVKVVRNAQAYALYFSRTPIPFQRNAPQTLWLNSHTYYKHIGMYAFQAEVLHKITKLPPSSLEKAESLEQLRWLENGYSIFTQETEIETLSIDTPEDYEKALKYL